MRKFSVIISGVTLYLFSFITTCYGQANNYQWVRNGGGTGTDQGNCVINTAGNIWKGGVVSSGAIFKRSDGTSLSLTNTGAYVAHYAHGKNLGGTNYYGYVNWVKNVQLTSGTYLPSNSTVKGIARNGNYIYVTGYYNQGSGPNMFVAKFDASTGSQFFPVYTAAYAYGSSIVATTTNLYITGGYEQGSIDFPLSPGSPNYQTLTGNFSLESYVLKLDLNFNLSWAVTGTSSNSSFGNGIYISGTKIYVAGKFGSSSISSANLSFAGASLVSSYAYSDIFVAQFENSNGNCNWLKRAGSTSNPPGKDDEAFGISGDGTNVYITGILEGNGTFGSFSIPSPGGFVAKYNSSGLEQWAVLADTRNSYAISYNNSAVYVCGQYYVARLSSSTGVVAWLVPLGTFAMGGTHGYGISAADACNLFITGVASADTWNGIPDPLQPNGSYDAFLSCITKNGSVTASITQGTLCVSSAFQLCGNGATSYSWNTNPIQTTQCININQCGTSYYTVTGPVAGCPTIATLKVSSGMGATITGGQCDGTFSPPAVLLNPTQLCATYPLTFRWQRAPLGGSFADIIPAQTNTTYTPTQLGHYRLRITSPSGCEGFSNSVTYTNNCRLGNDSEFNGSSLNVSLNPNPASTTLTISIEQDLEIDARTVIMDMSGRVVAELPLINLQPGLTETVFDISGLSNGIYHVNLTSGEKVITKKFIKE